MAVAGRVNRLDGALRAFTPGLPYRLVRYADDWVLLVRGTRADAENKRDQAASVLSSMGLRLSEEKTKIVHIDEGFDFLG